MLDLIKYRKWWYILSLVIILPGTISLFVWGLKPSIDFTGGTQIEYGGTNNKSTIIAAAKEVKMEDIVVTSNSGGVILRTKTINEDKTKELNKLVESKISGSKVIRFDTVGPSISGEITRNAFLLVLAASLVIVMYIAYSFRKVPKPAKSFEFGIAAIIGLLHDALVLLGVFSLLGHFYGVEVDPLFITATLTVIGFSVHDTIVIFDRIRENLIKGSYKNFEQAATVSVFEMLPRTINTSFLVWAILLVLYIFGGETTRYFVLALLIGILSGTYSSILNATPLLVTWENFKIKRRSKV